MNRKFIFAFAAVAAMFGSAMLTSCSNDDEVAGGSPVSPQSSAISYNFGFNGKATKGLGLVNTDATDAAKIPNMLVWAYYAPNATGVTPGDQYIGSGDGGITVTNHGGVWKEDAQNTAYWPAETAPLNFQAIAPASDASFTVKNTVSDNLAHMVADVEVPTTNADQKDILMANEDNVFESKHGRKVLLNFKHVLSQVRFSVKTTSQQVSGVIEDIALCNIKQTGTVGYHAADDVADGENAWKKVVLGTTVADADVASYSIGIVDDGSFDAAQYNTAKEMTKVDGSLLMLPQTTVKWTTADGSAVKIADANTAKNTYIKISCRIKNGNTYLVGSKDSFGNVYIPFEANWEMGKKYIYTINIGTGKGGFDENGNPLIQPISYSVAVTDWTDANSEVEL